MNALLLVDIQNDYFDGGAMALSGMLPAAERAAAMLERFRESGELVFHVQHLSIRPGATFFVPDTEGAAHHELVRPREGEPVVRKHFPNSFRDTILLEGLADHDIDSLTICGAMSHMCIDATVRAAFDLGFTCTVVEDACATRDLEHNGQAVPAAQVHAAFMAALAMPYATVAGSADLLRPGR